MSTTAFTSAPAGTWAADPVHSNVAFEIDSIDEAAREGWSVLIRGPAHHMDTLTEHDRAMQTGVEPWAGGEREHAIRITPHRISGRRIRQAG